MGGTTDKISGRAKEATGALTGNDELEAEGKVDRVGGEVKDKADDAVDGITDRLTKDD